MKKLFAGIIILFFCISVYAQDKSSITTYYLIRHAEKIITKDSNPELTLIGEQRAKKWSGVFKNVKFDAVYSTNYIRTMATAQPTATAQNLAIINYHPVNIDYTEFKESTKGKVVLIVGHSNTIPGIVNRLISKVKYKNIEDDNNCNLYIVEMNGDRITDKLLFIK